MSRASFRRTGEKFSEKTSKDIMPIELIPPDLLFLRVDLRNEFLDKYLEKSSADFLA
jgi:hypothetical protein